MSEQSIINPLCYVLERQYKNNFFIRSKLFSERLAKAKNLYRKDLSAHYGCVNAIEFSQDDELLVSGGDDRRVLIWSVPCCLYDKGSPVALQTNHNSNIFCLGFNSYSTRIFSGGNDDQVIVHDVFTGDYVLKLPHKKPVYGLSVNPQNDDILATAGDDGRILLYDIREWPSTDAVQCLSKQKTGFHSVMYCPTNPRLLTSANSEEGISLWDSRKPKEPLIHFDSKAGTISGISACFNREGNKILALRRRLPPVLYSVNKEEAVCQFYHPEYYNSCTMKTCCFAGENDEYVLSGSDDFNLYMWEVPKNDAEWGTTHLVLKGHRSIVNQVRYNRHNNIIASSGVEKMIKLWSTLPIGNWKGSLLKENGESSRPVYTHEEYIYLVGSGGERISHDYSEHSVQEDSKMMAFFDSLIQREIEGWDPMNDEMDLSDSDSDDLMLDYNNLSKTIFPSKKNTSEENKKQKLNKIAQLIAKKRNSLAKMAHAKSPSSVLRNHEKIRLRSKHKGYHKYKAPKHKRNNNCNQYSKKSVTKRSDGGSRRLKNYVERTKLKKYITRQHIRAICDNINSLDAPSTSTGITSSHNIYRVVEQDSDEETPTSARCLINGDVENSNLVNILPTPINGTHDMLINVLEMTEDIINRNSESMNGGASTSRGQRRRYDSSSCSLGNNGNNYDSADTHTDTEDDSEEYECEYLTPVKRKRSASGKDSGISTGPSSSKTRHDSCSSDDELEKQWRKAQCHRVTVKKQIMESVVDSDSN